MNVQPSNFQANSLEHYWMPFTSNRDFKADPRLVVKSEGVFIWDHKGGKIIDGSSGLFCVAAGHGRTEIADAVHSALMTNDYAAPFGLGPPDLVLARPEGLRDHAGADQPHLLRQFGFRGDRYRPEDLHGLSPRQWRRPARALRVARARLSRRQYRRHFAVGHGQEPRDLLRRHAQRCVHAPHLVAGKPLRARSAGRGRGTRERSAAFRRDVWRLDHSGLFRGADRRLDRRAGAAQGISRAPARDLRPARHPARVRRGDLRLRPARHPVRRPGLRRHARPHDHGQGPDQRLSAHGRLRGQGRHLRHADERRAGERHRVLPRLYLFRTSRGLRGGARDPGDLPVGRSVRARGVLERLFPRRHVRP